jgi:hypothetical protein
MRREQLIELIFPRSWRLCFACKFLSLVFILLLSLGARAEEPVCKTVARCLYLQGQVESQLEELRKHPPPPDEDVTGSTDNSNRAPRAMTHDEAIDFCSGPGGRLPTALELAHLVIKQGGKNIAPPSDRHDLSYKPVDARNPDGSIDHFLFSYQNYPYGALTQESPVSRIWSSSMSSKDSDPEAMYFYALRDGEGFFVLEKKDSQYAVFLREMIFLGWLGSTRAAPCEDHAGRRGSVRIIAIVHPPRGSAQRFYLINRASPGCSLRPTFIIS